MEKMVDAKKKQLRILFVIFCALVIFFYVINAFTDGATLGSVYEYVDVDVEGFGWGVPDGFTDHTQSVGDSFLDPYADHGSIYPPMASLIYKVLGEMLPVEVRGADGRKMMHWIVCMILLDMLGVMGMVFCIRNKMMQYESFDVNWVVASFLLSAPLMFSLERGNIALLAAMLSLLFVVLYESEERHLRELSYICLALAFSIKIYPAILGILLVRKKDFIGILKSAVYGALLILLPFLFYYGMEDMRLWITNLTATADSIDNWGYCYNLSLYSISKVFGTLLGVGIGYKKWAALRILVFGGLGFAMFFSKKKQNALLAAVLLLILIPNASYYYVALFLWIPLLEIIKDAKEKMTAMDVVLLVCMLVTMAPLALPRISIFWWGNFKMSYSYLIYDMAIMVISVITVFVAINDVRNWIKERKSYV